MHRMVFSAPMVRALLDGRKTMTRRIVRQMGPSASHAVKVNGRWRWGDGLGTPLPGPRFHVGDTIAILETWRADGESVIEYAADNRPQGNRWRSPIHMPAWAVRIHLAITSVRVERVQQISEEDATREGVESLRDQSGPNRYSVLIDNPGLYLNAPTAKEVFAMLWDAIHGDGAWECNDWVWVIGMERCK